MKRKYEQKRRAERARETRQRIVEAAVGLHTSVGPARTTIAAIAERAGVQRHTVYAHFPSDGELFEACSTHWAALHPLPDSVRWAGTEDPEARLREALTAMYEWYDAVGRDLDVIRHDAGAHATTAELVGRREARLLDLRDELARGWPRRKSVRAAIAHALELETWQSLVQRHGLTRDQAVDAMIRFVSSV